MRGVAHNFLLTNNVAPQYFFVFSLGIFSSTKPLPTEFDGTLFKGPSDPPSVTPPRRENAGDDREMALPRVRAPHPLLARTAGRTGTPSEPCQLPHYRF